MKKTVITLVLSLVWLDATAIKLTKEQQKDWQIETAHPKLANSLVLGEYMGEVVTPPQLFYSISLPFDAQIKKLYVAQFDRVKKGDLIAEVTGRAWIELQKRFLADAIELKHHGHLAERKNRLCKEGIIAKKQCTAANAELSADRVKASASKALLRSYGASKAMIHNLFEKFKISKSISLHSSMAGTIFKLNIHSGSSTTASDTLVVIQKDGALWLEVAVPIEKAMQLKINQSVRVSFFHETFQSKLLLKSPKIDSKNQTQKLRFSLPKKQKFLTGIRGMVKLSITTSSFKVEKKSIISLGDKEILFVETDKGYEPKEVEILGEDKNFYYINANISSTDKIATTSLAILKGMIEEDSDE